jgi:molybdate transport system permease protein
MDWQAFVLTLKLAAITTVILLCIAVPFAGWITLSRSRLRVLAEAVTALPIVLPPTVLGFYLLVLLGPMTSVGRGIASILGHPLAFSFEGLVVGSVIYSLPFAVQPVVAGFSAVDSNVIDAARLLGADSVRMVRTVLVPLGGRSLVTAAILVFLHTMGEFGVVLMLGGDIPGATRTLSLVLFNQVEAFNYPAANRTAGLLVLFSIASLVLVYARPNALALWTSGNTLRRRNENG